MLDEKNNQLARLPHARGDEPHRALETEQYYVRLPHARGDEPKAAKGSMSAAEVCPTHVGMNRSSVTGSVHL